MIGMAKKQPDSKRTQGVDRHLKPRLAFHLDQDLLDAMERYIETTKPKPTTTSVIVTAIEEFLTSKGCWPQGEATQPTPAPSPSSRGRARKPTPTEPAEQETAQREDAPASESDPVPADAPTPEQGAANPKRTRGKKKS